MGRKALGQLKCRGLRPDPLGAGQVGSSLLLPRAVGWTRIPQETSFLELRSGKATR